MDQLINLAKKVRYGILTSTTKAGSGHPTSSLSAADLMTVLFFGGFFHFDPTQSKALTNDRIIFSKGHAAPLLFSLYYTAGLISEEELLQLRTFTSPLEGHPTPECKFVDVATGSLGQGLSMGLGMALGIRSKMTITDKNSIGVVNERQNLSIFLNFPKVYVLLGDSEMAEGQVWEAIQLASYYKANNLVGIIDVNRLGQRGETMLGWDIATYEKRVASFGWKTIVIQDGHNLEEIQKAFEEAKNTDRPVMIIAKTIKGKGIFFWENQEGRHSKTLNEEECQKAIAELGDFDHSITGTFIAPEIEPISPELNAESPQLPSFEIGALVATKEAYGLTLVALAKANPQIISLDGEVSNSTSAEMVKKGSPDQFYEMFIAEQNMVSVGVGFSKIGYTPFLSTFAAFFTRALDQIRMARYSEANLILAGSYAGVSIGRDGSSQMGIEDIAFMRCMADNIVVYPSDAVSTAKLLQTLSKQKGIRYLRATREKIPVIYANEEEFPLGELKVVRSSEKDTVVIIAAGITLHESLKAYDVLLKQGISARIIDCYSIKPLPVNALRKAIERMKKIVIVEDHRPEGGLGETILSELKPTIPSIHLAVRKIPHSGSPQELLHYEEIDAEAITQICCAPVACNGSS